VVLGVLIYCIECNGLEVVSCDADPPGRGVGRALVGGALDLAREHALRRVWCTTTNDNLPALGFWQAIGFALVARWPGAVADARELKPSVASHGYRGLASRDELDLELTL